MKKSKMILASIIGVIAVICLCFTAIFTITNSVKADDVTYESTVDRVSIGDLASVKTVQLTKNTEYTYTKKASRGSLILSFDYEVNNNDSNNNMQVYFEYNDGSNKEVFWIDANLYWFRDDNIFLRTYSSVDNKNYNKTTKISTGTHSIELGRLAEIKNKKYTGNYYCYIKIDGTEVVSATNTYDYTKFVNRIFITAGESNENKLTDPNFVPTTYETADEISISDLMKNGKPVGNKIVMTKHQAYTYNKTTTYGSLKFSFKYKCTSWTDSEEDDCQFSLWSTWHTDGMFWLRPDNSMVAYQGSTSMQYEKGAPLTVGTHNVELVRLAIMRGGEYTGNCLYYITVDGETVSSKIIPLSDLEFLGSNYIFMTGTVNSLIDSNWTGNHITFMSNGEVYDEYDSQQDYISAPETNPQLPGKSFIGWFDDIGNEWNFSKDEVAGNMILTAGFVSTNSQSVSDEEYFDDDTYTPVLRMFVSSDTHIGQSSSVRNSRLAKEFEVAYNYADNSSKYTGLDVALFAGDLSDDGSPIALNSWKNIVNNSIREGTALIVSMGNHEFRTYDSVTREVALFEEIMKQECDYHIVIKGYHFIALSPNLNEGYNFSKSKVAWLDEQLQIASQDTPDKPIFVIQHENIKGTVYGSIGWGMDELTDVLCKYPQVVDFSGHSHYPLTDPRSIWQGTFTAFNTGTIHFYEIGINGYKNGAVFPSDKEGGWSGSYHEVCSSAEYMIIELDANNAMRVIVYDLLNDREITRYYLRDLLEDRKITYSHTQRAKNASAPVFEAGNKLDVTVKENALTIEFDQATYEDRDFVESYRIEFYVGGNLVRTEYALSDYFFKDMPDRIKYNVTFLDEDTEYEIKVFAVNVWNQESETFLTTTAKTTTVAIYEDVVDEITLEDLYGENSKKKLTTDTLKSWLPSYFIPSANNVYGSFKLTLQLLYIDGDFQFYWNNVSIYTNNDLLRINDGQEGIYLHEKGFKTTSRLQPGLYTIVYGRYHISEGANKGRTCYYVEIDMDGDGTAEHYEYISGRQFTNDGHIIFNFNSCYKAGSRYYSKNTVVPRSETPTFEKGSDVILSTPITNWSANGGALIFDSLSPELSVELHDSTGAITNAEVFSGSFMLGTKGDYYHYEIKTNKFTLLSGITGEELITKIRILSDNFVMANKEVVVYEDESFEQYDEISILDIGLPNNTGIYYNSPTEHGFTYAGSSPTYSAVLKYYLVCDEITPTSEFRSQLGTLWSYFSTLWVKEEESNIGYYGFQMTTRPIDKYTINLKSRNVYYVETGTIRVATGEWAGWNYTYFKINDTLYASFYCPITDCPSTSYQVAFKILGGYKVADISLVRSIEYYVGNEKYTTQTAISGANIYEPTVPTLSGKFFTGWYTSPTGGERVNFSNIFTSESKTVKYYARFADEQFDVDFYSEGELYQTQKVGKGGQALVPTNPVKEGTVEYSFVKWVVRGTNNEYDFTQDITKAIELESVFEERQYKIIYRVDGIIQESLTRYYKESNSTVIIGGEPAVPAIPGAEGYWDYDIAVRTKGDTYAIARYNASVTLEKSSTISLSKFNGEEVDIDDDLTRYYLSFADTEAQGEWLLSYPVSGGHERQNISFSWTDSEGSDLYIVYFADNENFNNAFVRQTNKTTVTDVGIFVPGITYYWKVVKVKGSKVTVTDFDTFEIINATVRWISAGTVYNTRDIGGWLTTDGQQVKYGMMYRGGQLSLDQSGEASYMDNLSYQVFDYLGIKTEIELRGESTHTINQFNELEKMIHVNGNGYEQFFTMNESATATYKAVFAELANEDNYPFYFHCSWGADRTGGLGFLINGLLGVPYKYLVEDFELTSLSYSGARYRSTTGFDTMYTRMRDEYGDGTDANFKNAIYNYLRTYVGVPAEQLDKIRELMLEPASEQASQYTITYRIDGEEYLQTKAFAGSTISAVAPVYFDKHLDCWLLDGEPFDFNTPITCDLVLDAKYVKSNYEEYDIVTIRDLSGLGESWTPVESEPFSYTGGALNGTKIFEFYYTITSPTGTFNDGVHVELGSEMWAFKAQVWFAEASTQHIFVQGTGNPQMTAKKDLKYGETYLIQVGVVIPLEGDYAGKKVFIFMVDGEIISQLECSVNLVGGYKICMAGTQGVLTSTNSKRTITYKVTGQDDVAVEVSRGSLVTAPEKPQNIGNKSFIGWFDELGNEWNFENDIVLLDKTLFARFGDQTINALVLDSNDMEVVHDYKVKVGDKVSELTLPMVNNSLLEFEGWYNGTVKLTSDTVVTEDMNLICKFNIKEIKTDDGDSENTSKKDGCKSNIINSLSPVLVLTLAGFTALKKKKNKEI